MDRPLVTDIFAEDMAHEELLRPLILRVSRETSRKVDLHVRSARGGHGQAIGELKVYQRSVLKGVSGGMPGLVIVAMDANCKSFAATRDDIVGALEPEFSDRAIVACPDPHIERWFLADLKAFDEVVGITPSVPQDKCDRDFYKQLLARAVVSAGHPATLGGIESAEELAGAMDFYRAGKSETSLKHFIQDLTSFLRRS